MFLKLWFIQSYISKHYFFITAIFMVLKSNNTYSICSEYTKIGFISFMTLYNNIPLFGYSKTTRCYSTW